MSSVSSLQTLKKQWDAVHPLTEHQQQKLQDKLRLEWIYNSNAIEGNSLSLGETAFFLREGLTAEGKPLKDYLEANNHLEAIEAIQAAVVQHTPISESFIKQLHQVLLKGIDVIWAKGQSGQLVQKSVRIGQYKQEPNHVLTLTGEIHQYVEPVKVPEEMEQLVQWIEQQRPSVEAAAKLHYDFVRIHPFDDGNGRMARILMNIVLMQAGYPPCIIRVEQRREYLQALEAADQGKMDVFIQFIMQELVQTMKMAIAAVK